MIDFIIAFVSKANNIDVLTLYMGVYCMVLKTSKDIEAERRQNNTMLNLKIPLKERESRLKNNERLKQMEMYAKTIESTKLDDFSTFCSEYKQLVGDLSEYIEINNASLQTVEYQCDELVEAIESLRMEKETLTSLQTRLAIIGAAMENQYTRLNAKFSTTKQSDDSVQSTKTEKKEKNIPEKDYRDLVFHVYGRNKGLAVLRDEGYDI